MDVGVIIIYDIDLCKGESVMRRYMKLLIIIAALSIALVGCSPASNSDLEAQLKEKDDRIAELEAELEALREEKDEVGSDNLLATTVDVLELLKEKDMEGLSNYVHPDKGLRFSPYGYIDVENHLVFSAEEVAGLADDDSGYTWGAYDGSGEPVELTFDEYYDQFIFDEDFTNPQLIGNNVRVGQGNTVNNIGEVYPEARFIELHFQEIDPKYEGMDWRSLRLVFEELDGQWYLVAIIHDQWTI